MQVYLVGGAVRDQLLNYPFHERDWVVVGATPQQLLDLNYQQVGKDFPVFLHPDTKEEYALARTERKSGKGYAGFECYSAPNVTLEDDLQRRDLTINAIAQDQNGNLVDPYNGQQDIQQKVLRHVSDAFTEDPLRVLRIARFYARYKHLGFTIAQETSELMQTISTSGELEHLSHERIWVETEKALNEASPEYYFIALKQCQALSRLFPLLAPVTEQQFELIDDNHALALTAEQRFALLFSLLPSQAISKALKTLKIPNQVAELAQLVNQFHADIAQSALSPERILEILQLSDAYRRPERFQQLLTCCDTLSTRTLSSVMTKALELCQSIDAKQLAQQGLKGPAIGQAIQEQRLALLSEFLKNGNTQGNSHE